MATFRVFPQETVPTHSINVSLADTLVPMVWIKQLLFWQIDKQTAYEEALEDLREGLSRLITEIPALAGHVIRRGPGSRDISIAFEQNACIEFKRQDASKRKSAPSFDALERSGFPIEWISKEFYPKIASDPVVEGSPCFWAQFNRIKGGAVLVFGFNHVLADGWSCAEIERLWALHTADASGYIAFRKHKVVTPDVEIRRQLSSTSPGGQEAKGDRGGLSSVSQVLPEEETLTYLHKNVKSFKAAIRKTVFRMLKSVIITGGRLEPRSLAVWSFSSESLARLKEAASIPGSDSWISTKDALACLFWSRICAVHKPKTKELAGRLSTCLLVLNIRKRLSPTVPDEYIGNVVGSTVAQISLSKLCSPGIEGVQIAAQALRHANKLYTATTFTSALSAVNNLPAGKAFGLNRDFIIDKNNLFYDDFSALSSNTLDWGENLGRVARTRFPSVALPAGASTIMVYPKFEDGSLEVSLTSTGEMRRKLDADEVFGRYARLVCHECPNEGGLGHVLMAALWWWISRLGRFWWWKEVVEFRKKGGAD